MKLALIGTGYVGLVSGACFSEFGFDVTCIDKDADKIDSIRSGVMPIYEPGLKDLLARNVTAGRLHFTTELGPAVAGVDAVFIAVGTPTRRGDGHADLTYVFDAARELAGHLSGYTVVVTKSTVPVGTGRKPETDDMRDSPSLDILPALVKAGAMLRAYDPKAMEEARTMLPDATIFTDSAAACLEGADVAVVITEWNEFRALTPAHFLDAMRGKVLVDLRNIYRPEDMRKAGLSYHSIGRK